MESSQNILEQSKTNSLFSGVDTDSLFDMIFDDVLERRFKKGEMVFEEATREGMLFLLVEGRVQIEKRSRIAGGIILAVLQPGEFFGELEVLDGKPRSARAVALDDCVLLAIPKAVLEIMIGNSHAVTLNLLRTLSLRLRSIDFTFVLEHERATEMMHKQLQQLEHLIEAAKILNSSLDLDQLLTFNLETALRLIQCDRGTLYLVDEVKNELWSKVLKASEIIEIRLPLGKGIAGNVAITGEIYNNSDVYSDEKFDRLVDQKTGYKTKSMLCVPVKDRSGKIIGVFQLLNKVNGVFSTQDEQFVQALSTHVAIAITNAQVTQQMVQSERLAAVGKMAATIVHDIKNPLTTLRLNAEILKRKVGSEELSKHAEQMISQVDRFVSMAQEILDFTRGVTQLNIQEVSFIEVIDGLVQFIRLDFDKKKISLVNNNNYHGNVKIDSEKILRVFYNIAGNAADAMPKGGTLTINSTQKESYLLVEFSDTGIGMPVEVKDKIFEPFMTYGKKVGTGLGMAITKKIVEDHKGKIEVDSILGKGTTIRIFLPL